MKKSIKQYLICWIVFVALFNVISFVVPDEYYKGSFWSSYVFIMVCLCVHLGFIFYMLNSWKKENTMLVTLSFVEIIGMCVAGIICMVIPNFPNWAGTVICSIILAVSIGLLVSTQAVEQNKNEANNRLNQKIDLMKELVDEAQPLKNNEYTRKVYEALKYSDPTSTTETIQEEKQIKEQIQILKQLIQSPSKELEIKQSVDNLLVLIELRNNKCLRGKRRK